MRVEVSPARVDVVAGQNVTVTVTVTNTGTVIGGYVIRLLGADPSWVRIDEDQLRLFPDEVRTVTARVEVPAGLQAGTRRIAVQVRELTPPEDIAIREIDLTVPGAPALTVRADPITVTAGKRAAFSLIAENTGNTVVDARLAGDDPEGRVGFVFDPPVLHLVPGEHTIVDMRASARRKLLGSPRVRPLSVYVDHLDDRAFFADPAVPPVAPASPAAAPAGAAASVRDEREAAATAAFVQKPVIGRGAVSLVGLLVTVSVFAVVITIALSRLVGQSTADRNLALQVAAARSNSGVTGTAALAGTVRQLTSKQGVADVSVSIFDATDLTTPVRTTATGADGGWSAGALAAGSYLVSFQSAGFVELWYPDAASPPDAKAVTLTAGASHPGVDVYLGGVPATISGSVTGADVSGATLYLESVPITPPATGPAAAPAAARLGQVHTAGRAGTPLTADPSGSSPSPATGATGAAAADPGALTGPDGLAVVQRVGVAADGSFSLANVPSPSLYRIVVTKAGYATSVQQLDLAAGENRSGVTIGLIRGDGSMSGHITDGSTPLAGVTVTATSGQSVSSTVSQSTGPDRGRFTLRNLPTPANFTVVASADGYVSQTLTLSLSAAQQLSGLTIALSPATGSLAGTVLSAPTLQAKPTPAAGVVVSASDGTSTVRAATVSSGRWQLDGLALPGTYTITFSRSDLAPQTVSVTLGANGSVSPGSQGVTVVTDPHGRTRIGVTMVPSTATVAGVVVQTGATACAGSDDVPEATVSLTSGTTTYTVVSAALPSERCGQFEIDGVAPGTYTLTVAAGSGTSPTSSLVQVEAGVPVSTTVTLQPAASISGTVRFAAGASGIAAPASGWTVFLYPAAGYPNGIPTEVRTAADGTYRFAGVDAGEYVVAVGPTIDPNGTLRTKDVVVTPSQAKQVDFSVGPQ